MKNVLILAMSTLPKDIEHDNYYQYQDEDGDEVVFTARSQLEPITYMLCRELGKKREKLDKIVILETEETLTTDEKPAAVAFYKERVGLFAEGISYKDIPIDEKEPAEGIRKATHFILQEFEECIKRNDKMKFWIDTQGGFRDVVMVFTAIISLLREQGIEAEGIYSIRFRAGSTREKPCPIIDQTAKYDIFKFVSAMQEFMDFGKATGLKKYYGEENSFVQAVDKIADAIQLCQPQMFEDALRGFAAYLKSEQYKTGDPYLQIFIAFIKNDYGILLEKPDDTIEQIKWCVRKEFYQQAMTIYTERIPKYYLEKGILDLKVDFEQNLGPGKNRYADAFYTDLFEEMLRDEKSEQLNDIFIEVIAYKRVNELSCAVQYLRRKQMQLDLDQTVNTAIDTLIERLQNRFDDSGNRTGKRKNKGAQTIREYIEKYCGGGGSGNRSELLGEKGKNGKEGVYERKVRAIKEAKNRNSELVKMMEYYLAIKLLRNRMNHASEEEGWEDEKKALAFLKSEGIETGIEIVQGEPQLNYQKIQKLIKGGLNCFDI